MVPLLSLSLPILLGAILVFVVSSIIHMVFKYHQSDVVAVPQEEQVAAALRPFNIPPGDYMLPKPADPKEMQSPAFVEKLTRGPVVFMTVYRNQPFAMGKSLARGYGLGLPQDAIWWGRSWSATAKSMFDALVYGLVTAGAFGWLWP